MAFRDARLKIDRAIKHITDIKARLVSLQDSETSIVQINRVTTAETLKHDFIDRTALVDVALMLGDAVHNLKCALDYTWFQTIERLAPSAVGKFSKFPIYEFADQLKTALEGREIHISAPELFQFMLTEIKPCNGGNPAIWAMHKLDIRDKHRLLIPVFTNTSIVGIEVEDERGERHFGETWPTTNEPPFCVDYVAGIHVKDKGILSYEVICEDSGNLMDVPGTFVHYSQIILKVVELFERFLEAQLGG